MITPDDPLTGELHGLTGVRGANQSGMRAQNERLVLSILRRQGPMAKAGIARLTGLSAQTVSVIMRALELDGLLAKGDPIRGKVGQPSVPMHLAPNGAYFFGLKVGRRSLDLVLIDFLGRVQARLHRLHDYPTPDGTIDFVRRGITELSDRLAPGDRARLSGLGIAMPFQLWDWAHSIGVSPAAMSAWRTRDIQSEIAERLPFPVYMQNDASSACGAELVFGTGPPVQDFLYFYIGYFIGGGVVLNGSLYAGRSGNAGALGSMPVPGSGQGQVRQLIDVASLSVLEKRLIASGYDTEVLWRAPDHWSVDAEILADWIELASKGIASAVVSAAALIDFEAALIDGWIPPVVRDRLVQRTHDHLHRRNLAGIRPPCITAGTAGPDARAVGAASLPLSVRFLTHPNARPSQA